MTIDDISKKAVLYLLKRGTATQNELSHLSGYSRQIIRHWARESQDARAKYVKQQWAKAIRFVSK